VAANTSPIYSRLGDIQWIPAVTTANTSKDLTSGTIYLVFTADATNGGYVDKVVWQPDGSNVATAGRIWLNNGAATGTAANNCLLKDVTLPLTTNSEVAAIGNTEVTLGLMLPVGYKLYVTIGTTVAAGFHVAAIGGKY
jgi:hypothetical protein